MNIVACAGISNFLYKYGRGAQPIHPAFQKIAFDLISPRTAGPHQVRLHGRDGRKDRPHVGSEQTLWSIAEGRFAAHQELSVKAKCSGLSRCC